MATRPSIADRLIDAALTVTARIGWVSVTMTDVAREAGVSLADTLKHFRSKSALLTALLTRTDRRLLEGTQVDSDEPVRDRLFEVIMRRFDILQPHKSAVTAMLRDLPRDPLSAMTLLPQFALSMLWMLEAAGVSTAGPLGFLRAQGLAVVYLTTLRVWMTDDTQDMSRTMAALDKALTRVDALIQRLPKLGGSSGQITTAAPKSDSNDVATASAD